MEKDSTTMSQWHRRLLHISLLGFVVAVSFTLGATVTAVIAVRILLPMAAAGMTMGLVGMASYGVVATNEALYRGDSETRKATLVGLKDTLSSPEKPSLDPQLAEWIVPALEQCFDDEDPEVVALAIEVNAIVRDSIEKQPVIPDGNRDDTEPPNRDVPTDEFDSAIQ